MYVNIKSLLKLLEQKDPIREGHYLGKWSVNGKDRLPVRNGKENNALSHAH